MTPHSTWAHPPRPARRKTYRAQWLVLIAAVILSLYAAVLVERAFTAANLAATTQTETDQ